MTTYNGAAHVDAQLASIADQSRPPDELVIADDGSSDDTLAICRRFAARAPFPVRIFDDGGPRGFTRNFERALLATQGALVFLCDQDDVWYPEKIATMVEVFERDSRVLVAIHDVAFCDGDLNRIGQTKLERVAWYGDPANDYQTGMATAVRRTLIDRCLPIPGNDRPVQTHDRWLHGCAALADGRRVIPTVLADYRRHGANTTAGHLANTGQVTGPEDYAADRRRRSRTRTSRTELREKLQFKIALAAWGRHAAPAIPVDGDAVAAVDREARALDRRLDALSRPRVLRTPWVLFNWIAGDYRFFSGFRSVIKDVVFN